MITLRRSRLGHGKPYLSRAFLRKTTSTLILWILTACSFSLAQDIPPPPGAEVRSPVETQAPLVRQSFPLVPPNPAAGETIYQEKCAPCHGNEGRGDGPQSSQLPNPPAALAAPELARQASPAQWYAIVTQGDLERFMPPFNSLSDRQRWDVVAYALTLSTTSEQINQGARLYRENCVECHGSLGEGNGSRAGELSAVPTNFTDQALMAERSLSQLYEAINAGVPPDMPGFETWLSDEQRWALAAYLRSLTFTPSETAPVAQASETSPTGTISITPESTQATQGIEITPTPPAVGRPGTISGQVSNLSGGQVPLDLEITLHGFDDMQQVLTATTTVGPQGTFLFENVEMPEGRAFIASLEYQGVVYSSDVSVVTPDTTELFLPIPIYETTSDPSAVSVDRLHLLLEYADPGVLHVVELYVISNLGDRTLIAAQAGDPVLTFPLPEGAVNLQLQDGVLGERFVELPGGFGDMAAVRPAASQHQVVFSYELPYDRKLDLRHLVNLPVNAAVILLPEDGLRVIGDSLQDMGTREVQGLSYHMYSSGRIEAGSELRFTISGRPATGRTGLVLGTNSNLIIGLIAFGLALISAGTWFYMRSRYRIEPQPEAEGPSTLPANEDVDTILDAILALDDQFQAGELPEEAYQARRMELKARLQTALRNQNRS